jgi:ATP-dependent RNA helicase DHX57
MGGITNRDAKRTKNKVFSSGGGGGTKGAAVVDKRGQELQCPYCDRLFKQTGRLQDHVKKQHEAEEADAAADGTHPPLAAVPAAAAPAARAPAPAAPAAPPAAPRMMDVGSAAGAYDVKSPKLLLHELLLRDKQPRPRYKASLAPDGAWRCKVVLPHPKQPSDKDVVVFLDDAHAAPTEEEAAQRAAVAALHRVAGDRALDRLLPRPYLAQWQELGRRRQEREAREARDEERRAGRALATAAAARRRQPAAVIMTEDKRRLVESIIAEARDAGASSSAGFDDNDDDGGEQGGGGGAWESLGDVDGGGGAGGGLPMGPAALQEELVALGFREDDARRAVAVSCAGGAAPALSPALDWLCLNLEEDELPASFAPGAAGKPLTVLLRAPSSGDGGAGASRGSLSSAEAEAEAAAAAAAAALEDDPAAAELAAFGYPPAMCVQALREAGGHLHEAVRRLYGQLAAAAAAAGAAGAPPSTAAAAAGDAAAAAPDEWLEERVALEAIYGGDATFHSATWTSLRLSVLLDGAAARAAARHSGRPREAFAVDGAEVELQAWAPAAAAGCYPRAAPVLALRSPDVPPAALLTLTHRLAALCASLAGHPMLYEAASAAADQLPACLAAPRPARELFDDGADAAAAQLAAASLQGGAPPAGRRGRPAAGDRRGGGRAPTPAELAAESRRLLQAQRDLAGSAKHAAMRATRQRLPAFAQRGEVVAAVAGCRAVVVSGATGCGKSTQVPQYLLEEAVEGGAGGACNIVCTQPRRISAVGVATRVAAERGEAVGDVVGYSVRLDSKRSHRTRLLFCTTGEPLPRRAAPQPWPTRPLF